jgi:hypothetical protein
MIRNIQYFAVFLATLISAEAMGDAPKSPLYLVCESHLVAISTSVNQKIANAIDDSNRASISFDVRTLWKDREVGGFIDMDNIGWASREVIKLPRGNSKYGYTLNRISGNLSWLEERRRPKKPQRKICSTTTDSVERLLFDCDEIYMAVRGEFECVQEPRSRLNEIIKNHNRKVRDSQPERKF